MSKNINVNPGNYKVAGRERQGEDINHEVQRQAMAMQRADEKHRSNPHETAPGWEDPAQPSAESESSKRKVKKARKASKPGPRARVRDTVRRRATPARRTRKGQARPRRRGQ